ncbi:MAG: exodeoxyribonuclease VII large subunit [Pseudomonadota bacterium]
MDLLEDDGPEAGGPDTGGNAPEFSVSELSGAVKRVVEGAFDHVRVRGEVGRVSRPRSGHIYLDLKDDRAVLSGIIWKGVAARLDVEPEEGMEVVASGRLTTYPGQSRYQIIIESLAPAGVGALMALLEKRKAALAAEGLFAKERKRPIPYLPRAVGVVTSPSGAVIRDILHRLAERFPLPVLVWPVAVQGKACAPEVAQAIRGFNALPEDGPIPRPDVLIVARGGGSVEDLWGFNEEIVARAAAESAIPLISAVGHETDTTLIDYVADLRAPTPTAAAEIAAPVRGELLATLAALEGRSQRALTRGMEERRRRLRDLARALPKPEEIVAERRQRLDVAAERLPLALGRAADRKRIAFSQGAAGAFSPALITRYVAKRRDRSADFERRLGAALAASSARARDRLHDRAGRLAGAPDRLRLRLADARERVEGAGSRLDLASERRVSDARERLSRIGRLLAGLNPDGVLERGYAIVRRGEEVATRASQISDGDALSIQFADGRVEAVAGSSGAAPRKTGAKAKPPKPGQGELDL